MTAASCTSRTFWLEAAAQAQSRTARDSPVDHPTPTTSAWSECVSTEKQVCPCLKRSATLAIAMMKTSSAQPESRTARCMNSGEHGKRDAEDAHPKETARLILIRCADERDERITEKEHARREDQRSEEDESENALRTIELHRRPTSYLRSKEEKDCRSPLERPR